jgi:anti-anti-sigma factor
MESVNIKDTLKVTPQKKFDFPDTIVLELEGYLDTYNSKSFQQYVQKVIDEGYKYIIMDCKGLTYVSSTGIGSFTSFNRMLLQKKGELILVRMISKVYEVFKLLGFLSFFKIFDNFEEVENFLKGKVSGEEAPESNSSSGSDETSVFPVQGTCPVCSKSLRFSKSGKFRCPSCKSILSVDEEGNINKA